MTTTNDPMSTAAVALEQRHWRYVRMPDGPILTAVTGGGRTLAIAIRNDEERNTLVFLLQPIVDGSQDLAAAMRSDPPPFLRIHERVGHSAAQVATICERLMDANFCMLLGNFERLAETGDVRFRIALPYRNTVVTRQQVSWCIDVGSQSLFSMLETVEAIVGLESDELTEV